MTRGLYIVANDKVYDNAIALLNSIRLYDTQVPVYLIPYDDNYSRVAQDLAARHQVELFPDLEFLNKLYSNICEIFGEGFFARPNNLKKLVQWFGPLEEFLYIDTDIVVFSPIVETLNYLNEYEFVNCDFHYKGRKLEDIFNPIVFEKGIFTSRELEDVFNGGFWGSRRDLFSESELYELLREAAAHREYFDFERKTTCQPILNWLVLKATTKRLNLVKPPYQEPGSWAGSPHFEEKEHILYDKDTPLRYLHWAGQPMKLGGPYRELWEYYRYLGEEKPLISPEKSRPQWRDKISQLKKQILRG
jgi:hypothetical protein